MDDESGELIEEEVPVIGAGELENALLGWKSRRESKAKYQQVTRSVRKKVVWF